MPRLAALALIAGLALAAASAASGVGPWLGVADGQTGVTSGADTAAAVSYVATADAGTTTVAAHAGGRVLAKTTVPGDWGLPVVTLRGDVAGLSANGRVLVLARSEAGPQSHTSFVVLGTRPLAFRKTIRLPGDFGFDTLSPDGSTLYLIQHVSKEAVLDYRVRAYDLRAGKLSARVVADKSQRGWVMSGMPVARASSPDGRWVYTLYSSGQNYPFVHALDTRSRTAICIGLPWQWTSAGPEIDAADLRLAGARLLISGSHGLGTRFALDTRTFKVTKL